MNHENQHSEQSFDLPRPNSNYELDKEEAPISEFHEKQASISLEQAATNQGALSSTGYNPASLQISDPAANTALPSGVASITPLIADDGDLIEKEWVEKAKDIVNRTRHDPYTQNEEIKQVKADYLKKRYNKDLRIEN